MKDIVVQDYPTLAHEPFGKEIVSILWNRMETHTLRRLEERPFGICEYVHHHVPFAPREDEVYIMTKLNHAA